MDADYEDYDAATLDQQMQDERAQQEQIMLSRDAGYIEFLRTARGN